MAEIYNDAETRDPAEREAALFARLPDHLTWACAHAPALGVHLQNVDYAAINSRDALATLPILRKSDLMEAQAKSPPFGGFAVAENLAGTRFFSSPGPIWEPQGLGADPWGAAAALFAAGFRKGDVVHNALSYHMTPGGFILDEGARALGCRTGSME